VKDANPVPLRAAAADAGEPQLSSPPGLPMTLKRLVPLSIAIGACMAACWSGCHRNVSVDQVHQRLSSRLHPGMSPEEAGAALTSLKLDPSPVERSAQAGSEADPSLGPSCIAALVRDSCVYVPCKGDIEIYVYFDASRRLTTWRTREIYTGP
jgi:hypothetical protein